MKLHQISAFLRLGMAVGIFSGIARAAEEISEITISEWKFGETIFGKNVDAEGFEGKVVAIEYWGAGCGACLRNMTHLVEVDRKYRDQGLLVIAAEIQGSPKESIQGIVDRNKIEFTVTKGVAGPLSVRGMPYAIVFGADGKIVFDGRPDSEEFENAIKAALRNVEATTVVEIESDDSGTLIVERTWTNAEGKPLVASVSEIKGGKVIFRLRDGKEVSYAIEKLSEQDRKLLKAEASR